MSNGKENESNANSNGKGKQDELDLQYTEEELAKHKETLDWIQGTGNQSFIRLPEASGSLIVQFFKDIRMGPKMIEKEFDDANSPTGKKIVKRVDYEVIDPNNESEGRKHLNVPPTLASKIEMNKERGHYKLELIRKGIGLKTKYDVIAVT
jgi:hypothetical protein